MRDGTRIVRAGLPKAAQGEPFLPGPTFAGTYGFSGEVGTSAYTYGRYHNPTWTRYEEALGDLEGGPSLVFSSGMAAVAAVLTSVLTPSAAGSVLVMPSDGYYTARMLAEGYFASLGVKVRKAPTAGNAQAAHLEGATLLWLETPSNPGLETCDISELVEKAHSRNVLVAVDNTTATALGQQPLKLGADFSVSSDSKGLTGHSDLILGHVRDPRTRLVGAPENLQDATGSRTRTDGGLVGAPVTRNPRAADSEAVRERHEGCESPRGPTGGAGREISRTPTRPVPWNSRQADEVLWSDSELRPRDAGEG